MFIGSVIAIFIFELFLCPKKFAVCFFCFQELSRTKSELDKLQSLHTDASQNAESLDVQKKALREELRELKLREQRLITDYSELEEENIVLQKQVSSCNSLCFPK